jgi:hypothetical protein
MLARKDIWQYSLPTVVFGLILSPKKLDPFEV